MEHELNAAATERTATEEEEEERTEESLAKNNKIETASLSWLSSLLCRRRSGGVNVVKSLNSNWDSGNDIMMHS